jgi:uridine phosphorylase
MKKEFPILEFDPGKNAVINPKNEMKAIDIPEYCVICFFQDVINKINQQKKLTRVALQKSEIGKHPVYVFEFQRQNIALFQPGVGAPLSAGLFEEVIARGCKKFIVVCWIPKSQWDICSFQSQPFGMRERRITI